MRIFVPKWPVQAVNEPEIISMGTCGGLRVKRVGPTFFIENAHLVRDEAGVQSTTWKVVAVAQGPKAYQEAHMGLHDANKQVVEMLNQGGPRR